MALNLRSRRTQVLAAICGCALVAQVVPVAAAVGDPSLKLTVKDDVIYASGRNFNDNSSVALSGLIDGGSGAGSITTDEHGAFVLGFKTPDGFSGDVNIVATAGGSRVDASAVIKPDASTGGDAGSSPSGEAMPVGDLAGWKQIFTEDFNTPAAAGSWPGSAYGSKWDSYNGFGDTAHAGQYSNSILSVKNGALDMYLHTENGTPLVAAPVAKINGGDAYKGQTYGRYSVRFKADAIDGYKTAWLLWPDTNQWTSEIDFPEGELSGTIGAYNHCPGNASQNCSAFDTGVKYNAWHTATTEWTADAVKFYLDGKLVGSDNNAPKESMHMVLQTETNYGTPPAASQGHLQIDWVSVWAKE